VICCSVPRCWVNSITNFGVRLPEFDQRKSPPEAVCSRLRMNRGACFTSPGSETSLEIRLAKTMVYTPGTYPQSVSTLLNGVFLSRGGTTIRRETTAHPAFYMSGSSYVSSPSQGMGSGHPPSSVFIRGGWRRRYSPVRCQVKAASSVSFATRPSDHDAL